MRRMLFIPFFILLAACAAAQPGTPLGPVDPLQLVIYHNGAILTMDPANPGASAIAVRGEKIEAVGSNEDILALADDGATIIDLDGHTLMPGFVDAHTHLLNDARSQGLSLDHAQSNALRHGITALATLYTDEQFLREITAFDDSGFLRVRTSLYLVATDPCGNRLGDWWKGYPPTAEPGEMLRINGVKIFTDGGSCGGVALSFELEPGRGLGDLWFSQEELNELVAEVHGAGYQAAVHAIGDRAVHQALNSIEAALAGGSNAPRHRIEHVSVIDPADVPRFGELGVIPVLMGEFPNCTPYGPPVPAAYGHMEWPWRALRDANPDLPLAWHTDVPFQSIDPFDHLLGFVTRIDRLGQAVCEPAAWLVENTITVREALSIMTIESAYALGREAELGSLVAGKYADLVVLARSPLEMEPEELADNWVLMTMVGGRVEYCSTSAAALCPGHANRAPALLPDNRPPVVVRWVVVTLFVAAPIGALAARRRYADSVRRVGGLAGFLGGLAWVATLLLADSVADYYFFLLFMFPAFLMALGVTGLAAAAGPGRLSLIGLRVSLLGAIGLTLGGVLSGWFRQDLGWFLLLAGILAHTIGLVLFGTAGLAARGPWWLGGLPFAAGLFGGPVPFVASFIAPDNADWPFLLLLGVLGSGWSLLGGLLMLSRDGRRADP